MKLIKSNIFVSFAIITIAMNLIAQKLLPMAFPGQFSFGILKYTKDALRFHLLASKLADSVDKFGWSVFEWKPENQLPGGILGAIYALTNTRSPLWYMGLNCLLVGMSAYMLSNVLDSFWKERKYNLGILFILLFTPTSLVWTTQISKDIFVVFGFISVFYSLFLFRSNQSIGAIFTLLIGSISIFCFKNYMVEILLLSLIVFFCLQFLEKSNRDSRHIVTSIIIVVLLAIEMQFAANYYENAPDRMVSSVQTRAVVAAEKVPVISGQPVVGAETRQEQVFEYKKQFPVMDKFLQRLSYSNYRFKVDFPHGKENFKGKQYLQSTKEAILYIPLAIWFSLIEPHPFRWQWDEGIKKGALISILQIEMLLNYLAYGIILYFFWRIDRRDKLFCLGILTIGLTFLLILGFAVPNLGAINRYRFPFLLMFKITSLYIWRKSKSDNLSLNT